MIESRQLMIRVDSCEVPHRPKRLVTFSPERRVAFVFTRFRYVLALGLLLSFPVAGCKKTPSSGDGDADADTDGDSDSDSDSDHSGTSCGCDYDCPDVDGHAGVCVFGICMTFAANDCSSAGSSAECAAGSRCWGLGDTGVALCWPDCASHDCAGVCDEDGSCVPGEGDNCDPSCGSFCSDPGPCDRVANPLLRVSNLEFTQPASLATPLLSAILNGAIDAHRLIWLMELDITNRRMSTGYPSSEWYPPDSLEELCSVRWSSEYPPAIDVPISNEGGNIGTIDPIDHLVIPMFSESDPTVPLLLLSMTQLEIEGNFEEGRASGWISISDARAVYIEDLGTSLCDLLASAPCTGDPIYWQHQPEDIPGTDLQGFWFQLDAIVSVVEI